jgi:mono/diheme cytochrome c family protein
MTPGSLRRWTIALWLCILAARPAPAQSSAKKAPAAGRTTLSGVYTAAQASRGKNVYAGTCKQCHTPESHTGATFAKWWAGKQLSDLFMYVTQNMPKNDPGSLAPEEYVDVMAYLLRMNAMPVGNAELPPDPDELQRIRISLKRPTKKAQ